MASSRHVIAMELPGWEPMPLPRWALAPIATESLILALPMCADPRTIHAEALPICAPEDREASGILIRVANGSGVFYQRIYSPQVWCVGEWMASRAAEMPSEGQHPRLIALESSDGPSGYALPEVRESALKPLLAGATAYGETGFCPTVFERSAWNGAVEAFRAGLPNEVMLAMRGSLCRCPETQGVFTHITSADAIEARSAPDAVSATAEQVSEMFGQRDGGQFVGLAHSHTAAGQADKIVISPTDFATFRTRLRSAHMTSLIVNVAEGCDPAPALMSWRSGSPITSGFIVRGGGGFQ